MWETFYKIIDRFEGCADCRKDGLLHPYLCPAGLPTQGYGIRVASLNEPPITQEEALRRLKVLTPKYTAHALTLSPILKESPYKLAAITSFIYNLGPTAYAGSTLRKRVNAGQWELAAKEMSKWVFAKGKKQGGLIARRAVEAAYLLT